MRYPKYTRSYEVVAQLPASLEPLRRLAMNFRWTWHPETKALFREIDKRLWEHVDHSPIQMLRHLPATRLEQLATDELFLTRLRVVADDLERYLNAETWFDREHSAQYPDLKVAYFCAEFGLSEVLPIYSGGLGVLAGDHLKAASDLGLPLVGVGLLYSRGYFRQYLNGDGWQQEHYPPTDFYQLPLELQRGEDGQPIRIAVELPDRQITCQIWRADVGRVPLYLLDSNVMENAPDDQSITDTLYGGDQEMRLRQELILGVGGFRALEAVGVKPTVCHMNEGHAAFLAVERIRRYMAEQGCDFQVARQVTAQGNVFTTHTPVPAGFDLFSPDLVERYLTPLARQVELELDAFARLGRLDPLSSDHRFNMAMLAINTARSINGVAQLHGRVSRGLFQERWPDTPTEEVPIDAVTNGIHTPTWIHHRMAELFDRYLGAGWRQVPTDIEAWQRATQIPDEELWAIRERLRADLVRYVRKRAHADAERRGGRGRNGFDDVLDPRVLTIGFARRFATYKRATLLLQDRERLHRLLFHPDRPVQIILAGKSHPRDDGGKRLIQELYRFIHHEGGKARMVFLEDYDMGVARHMVQGVDLWLNTPRRPMEASGTSGMKVVPNGGLNASILDGWWDEGFHSSVGWAIGDGRVLGDEGQQDYQDAQALYRVLEDQVVPTFYQRINGDPPKAWLEMVKQSMVRLGPFFSSERMVGEYATQHYFPAHAAFGALKDEPSAAGEIVRWKERVRQAWPMVKVIHIQDDANGVNPLGREFTISARVQLGSLEPDDVLVEALIGQVGSNHDLLDAQPKPMQWQGADEGIHLYRGEFRFETPGLRGYVVRIRPVHDQFRTEIELPLVSWSA